MAKFKDDGEHVSPGTSAHAVRITAAKYFGKDGFKAIDTPENFLSYGKKLTDSDEEGLRKCISFMKEGLKTDGGSDIRRDVAGLQYRFYTFYRPKSRPGAKVILSPELVFFIGQYQNGNIIVDFTLDDLIEEAKK
jgi:hypothetical protein